MDRRISAGGRVEKTHKFKLHVNNTRQHVEWSTTTMSSFRKPHNTCVNVGVWLLSQRLRERDRDRSKEDDDR